MHTLGVGGQLPSVEGIAGHDALAVAIGRGNLLDAVHLVAFLEDRDALGALHAMALDGQRRLTVGRVLRHRVGLQRQGHQTVAELVAVDFALALVHRHMQPLRQSLDVVVLLRLAVVPAYGRLQLNRCRRRLSLQRAVAARGGRSEREGTARAHHLNTVVDTPYADARHAVLERQRGVDVLVAGVLQQHRCRFHKASVTWVDERRRQPQVHAVILEALDDDGKFLVEDDFLLGFEHQREHLHRAVAHRLRAEVDDVVPMAPPSSCHLRHSPC